MPFNIFSPDVTVKVKKEKKLTKGRTLTAKGIDKSKDLTGIEIRLLPPYIKDNHTEPFLFFKGYAKLYCVIVVVNDSNNQLVGGIDLQSFPRIGDKEYLPINKSIFYWQGNKNNSEAPTQVHTMISIIKSKKGLRKAGEIMADLGNDESYKSIVAKLAANSTPAGAVINIVTELGAIVGRYLGQVEDKPIATIVNSYTSLYGDFDKVGIKNAKYQTPNVDFSLDIVVRNKTSDANASNSPANAEGLQTKGVTQRKVLASGKKKNAKKYRDEDPILRVDIKPIK